MYMKYPPSHALMALVSSEIKDLESALLLDHEPITDVQEEEKVDSSLVVRSSVGSGSDCHFVFSPKCLPCHSQTAIESACPSQIRNTLLKKRKRRVIHLIETHIDGRKRNFE